jgi:hypothetical protein
MAKDPDFLLARDRLENMSSTLSDRLVKKRTIQEASGSGPTPILPDVPDKVAGHISSFSDPDLIGSIPVVYRSGSGFTRMAKMTNRKKKKSKEIQCLKFYLEGWSPLL